MRATLCGFQFSAYCGLQTPPMSAVFLIVFNICTNVSIILVNKYVFNVFHFNYATLVTFFHFVFTAYVSSPAGFFCFCLIVCLDFCR